MNCEFSVFFLFIEIPIFSSWHIPHVLLPIFRSQQKYLQEYFACFCLVYPSSIGQALRLKLFVAFFWAFSKMKMINTYIFLIKMTI